MAQMTKEEAINHILSINFNMRKEGISDVRVYDLPFLLNDGTGRGIKVIKMGINLLADAKLDAEGNIIYGGYTIKVWRN